MNLDFDVCVVGAGPVGSTVSYYLSLKGLSVVLLDKKSKIGYPLQCAGILSNHIEGLNELPDDVIVNSVDGAFLHSSNSILNIERDNVAYIIDRVAYDHFLLKRAIDSGVKLINQKATDFDFDNGLTVLQNNQVIKSKIIVGCDGHNSEVSKKMGNVQDNYYASQFLVKISEEEINSFRNSNKSVDKFVDVYILEDTLPGFVWFIPVENDLYRVGLFSNGGHKEQNDLLIDFLDKYFEFEIIEKYKGFIPIFNKNNKLIESRAILLGDAAGQIKPTSGGGLLIAFDACRFASDHIYEAISNDDLSLLNQYSQEFMDKYQNELCYQLKIQETFNHLSNEDFNYLFLKIKENDGENLISEYGDMDNQSILVKEFIKRGLMIKIIPSFLIKKVVNIFGFGE